MSNQTEYTITWEIEITANSKVEAANQALSMVSNMQSTAHAFEVQETDSYYPTTSMVDLDDTKETAESFKGSKTDSMFNVGDVVQEMSHCIRNKSVDKLETLIKQIHPDLLREYLGV